MFDPYHKWLGIPKDQRPPTHYQLLGVAPDEQDIEVIEEAAIRQTTHLRTYQIGAHAADCTRLLNEVAQAKQTLFDPVKRKRYDESLAAKVAVKAAVPAKPSRTAEGLIAKAPLKAPKRAGLLGELEDEPEAPLVSRRSKTARGERRKKAPANPMLPLAIAGGVAGIVLLGVVLILALRGGGASSKEPREQFVGNPNDQARKDNRPPDGKAKQDNRPPDGKAKQDNRPPDGRVNKDKRQAGDGAAVQPKLPDGGAAEGNEWKVEPWHHHVAVTPDPNLLLVGGADFGLLDLAKGRVVRPYGKFLSGDAKAQVFVSPVGDKFYGIHMNSPDIGCWSVQTGQELGKLTGHAGKVERLALTRDGQFLLSSGADKTVRLWDAIACKPVAVLGEGQHEGPVTGLAVSPDGQRAVSCSRKLLILWDLRTRKPLRTVVPHVLLRALAFSPDGQSIAATGLVPCLTAYNSNDLSVLGQLSRKEHFSWELAFAPDGKYLFTTGVNGAVAIVDWPERTVVHILQAHPKRVSGVAVSADGRYLFTVGAQPPSARRWPLANLGLAVGRPPVEKVPLEGPAVVRIPGEPAVWNVTEGYTVLAAAVNPDHILLGGPDVKLIDLATGKERFTAGVRHAGVAVTALAVSPNGQKLFAAYAGDPDLDCVDMNTGQLLGKLKRRGRTIHWLAVTPDGKHLLCVDDKMLSVWDTTTLKNKAAASDPHPTEMVHFAISRDGTQMATACKQKLGNWDGQRFLHLRSALNGETRGLTFTPDGRTILTTKTGDDELTLWHAQLLKEVGRKKGTAPFTGTLQFTPDGRYLVAQGANGRLHVLRWPALQAVADFTADAGRDTRFCVTRDGRFVYGISGPKMFRWELKDGQR